MKTAKAIVVGALFCCVIFVLIIRELDSKNSTVVANGVTNESYSAVKSQQIQNVSSAWNHDPEVYEPSTIQLSEKAVTDIPEPQTAETKKDPFDVEAVHYVDQNGEPIKGSQRSIHATYVSDILKYYGSRSVQAVETESDSEDRGGGGVKKEDIENAVNQLAQTSIEDAQDAEETVATLQDALKVTSPPEVRLQALYLLYNLNPIKVCDYLYDQDPLIKYEAEHLVGLLPKE